MVRLIKSVPYPSVLAQIEGSPECNDCKHLIYFGVARDVYCSHWEFIFDNYSDHHHRRYFEKSSVQPWIA